MTGSYDDFFWATCEFPKEDLKEQAAATMKTFCNLPHMMPDDELADIHGLAGFLHYDPRI